MKHIKSFIFIIFISFLVFSFFFLGIKYFNEEKSIWQDKVKEPDKSISLTLVGDFLFEEPYYASIRNGDDINTYFRKVKKYFEDDDISLGNMEVVIGNDALEVSGTGFNFCAPKYIGDLVSSLDLEVLSTINNHTFDRGLEGINSTLNYFHQNTDILTVGTYNDEAKKDKIMEVKGLKVGFLAYSYGTNKKVPSEYLKYVSLYKDPETKEFNQEYQDKIRREVTNLRDKVDVLIVLMHWGIEFTHQENWEQQELAKFLNSLGVDIIVGSHSHSMEPIKWVGNEHKTLVFYSLGNFTSADDDVSRAGEDFDNAYQVGLLAKLKIRKLDRGLDITNIKTEPIINYYDKDMRHFELVPISMYNEKYEKSHYRYPYNFNKKFIQDMYNKVIDEEYR